MKIVQVLTRGDVQGGAQSHVLDLSIALQHAGHQVTVITGRGGAFNQRLSAAGIDQRTISHMVRPIRPWQDLYAFIALFHHLYALGPDIICTHTAKAGWLGRVAARMLDTPSTFTPHGWSPLERSASSVKPFFFLMERLAATTGARIINVCEHEKTMAVGRRFAPATLLETVHNGIADLPQVRTAAVDRQPPRIIMVARYEIQKDHHTLLHALAGLKRLPWKLTLIGGGERQNEVKQWIREYGLTERIELLPAETDVASVLSSAQICVLSSNFEAFPISILEGMRASLPVVATAVGGVDEAVIHEQTGLLVPSKNVAALRGALERLITNPSLRLAYGAKGRSRFSAHFTADRMAVRTLEVYARACRITASQFATVPQHQKS
jgi:glycosyltransferase involved in cell wall biosynthesis